MKLVAPDYYADFKCIAGRCAHTCCEGWEIDVDEVSCERFSTVPEIREQLVPGDPPHIATLPGDRCPFLDDDGLCRMIKTWGEDMLCDICRDHPRFRNYWSDRTELGLGLVCEEAGRLILGRERPMELVVISDDGKPEELPEDEEYLTDLRDTLLCSVAEEGPSARLMEYLIYRHLPDALYDGLLEERLEFIREAHREITEKWAETDGSLDSLVEIARVFSYDVEYDDEELEKRINKTED